MPKGQYKRIKKWKLSEKTREKMSLARRKEWRDGKRDESKDKIRKTLQRPRPEFLGDKHPRWTKGNINYWKKQCKIRDNYTCQVCGLFDPEIMEVDHIKPKSKYPELYKDLNNMMTICPNCHRRKTLRAKEYSLR